MTETKETYTATSVADTVPDAMTPDAAILALAGRVADLAARLTNLEVQVGKNVNAGLTDYNRASVRLTELSDRLDNLQDAHLAPVLEGSAVVAQMTRIANFLEIFRPGVAHDNTPTELCDCDDLWRLARAHVSTWEGVRPLNDAYEVHDALRAYVREHTP